MSEEPVVVGKRLPRPAFLLMLALAFAAFVVGFVVYWALPKAGLRPAVIAEFQLAPPVSQTIAKGQS